MEHESEGVASGARRAVPASRLGEKDRRLQVQLSRIEFDPRFNPVRRPSFIPGRTDGFETNQDYLTFASDVYWSADGTIVHLAGPPGPTGLTIEFRTWPERERCTETLTPGNNRNCDHYRITVPPGTSALEVTFGEQREVVAIQPNLSAAFAGRRVLVAMSRDNELQWIVDWAQFHAFHHGVDAVVLYLNQSAAYSSGDIARSLATVSGLKAFAVIDWPVRYGWIVEPNLQGFWGQRAALEHGWRRLLTQAAWVINADVDELLLPGAADLDSWLAGHQAGSLQFPRTNVIAVGETTATVRRHLDHSWTDSSGDNVKSVLRPALVPETLRWGVHGLEDPLGRGWQIQADDFRFAHFLPLTTGWRNQWRWSAKSAVHPDVRHDDAIRAALDAALRDGPIAPPPWTPLEAESPGLARIEAERLAAAGDLAAALAMIEHTIRLEPDDPRHVSWRDDLRARIGQS